MTYINITKFVLINQLEEDHCMIETRRLEDILNFSQIILSFPLSKKIIYRSISLEVNGTKQQNLVGS